MSDRFNAFIVILEQDIRDDDAVATINAIEQIRGVLEVKPLIANPEIDIVKARLRVELWHKIYDVFHK